MAATAAVSCGGSNGASFGTGGAGDGGAGHGGASAAGTGGSANADGGAGTGGSGATAGSAGATAGATGTGGAGGSVAGTGGSAGTGGTTPGPTIDTIAQVQARAGDLLTVVCVLSGGATAQTEIAVSPADAVVRQGTDLLAAKAGAVTFTCAAPSLGLVDATPAMTTILPGPLARVHTTVDQSALTAGWTVYATCQGSDAFGNPVPAAATLSVSPTAATPVDLSVRLTVAGDYQLSCRAAGAQSDAATVHVDPALPATLKLAASPMSAVYPAGQVLSVSTEVQDAFGNAVPGVGVDLSAVAVTGTAPVAAPSPTSFRFDTDGRYEIRGAVVGPTATGAPVTAVLPVAVDGIAPAVICASPAAGAVVVLAPGASLTFSGTAIDPIGVATVTVNGTPTTVAANGAFTTTLTTRYGLNHVDVVATDTFGSVRRELCTFLVADQFVNEGAQLADSVSLRLSQAAVDDNSRANGLNSLDDLLYPVVNSQAASSAVHNAFLAANPLKPSACEMTIIGICVITNRVTYVSSALPGPNTVSTTLIAGGLQERVRFEDPRVRLRTDGMINGIPYDVQGDVIFDFVEMDLIHDVALSAGRPRVTIRPGSVAMRVGSVSTNFSGLDGYILNIVVGLANTAVRSVLVNALQSFVSNNFTQVLDAVISGLDIMTLGSSFNVPRFDGSGNVATSFGIGFSSTSVNATRMLFGMSTRFMAPAAHARPPTTAPIPSGTVLLDSSAGGAAIVADHVGVYQQAIQAFWRAGGLDGTSAPSAGAAIVHTTPLPPVIALTPPSAATLDLVVDATVTVTGMLSNVHARAAARARAVTALAGNDLSFTGVTLDEVHVVAPNVALSATERQALTDVMSTLLQQMASRTLNDALPALPIPTFPMPAALATFGLPTGGALGPVGPALTFQPRHFVLSGSFGIR